MQQDERTGLVAIAPRPARFTTDAARIPAGAAPPARPYPAGPGRLISLEEVAAYLQSTIVDVGPPSAAEMHRDRSTVIVCPTRGCIDTRTLDAWKAMIHPMNAKRIELFARGFEVAQAYNRLIAGILENDHLKTWQYVLTMEDDNLPPPDGHLRLLEVLEAHPEYSAVAGLYHIKDAARAPMAYGDPAVYRATGKTSYEPVDRARLDPAGPPVEVLGIPMGFSLWRMDLFREVKAPWFMTLSDQILLATGELVDHRKITNAQAAEAKRAMTQDLYFCDRAVRQGKRFAVVPSVAVGHLSLDDGMVY